ncbi:DUF551 domain-containing protein [Klebsiella quasipneumoniae]|uniref:DUF551 domain-containing protein n=2 Tax=Klebsiella pneumoniae complex TaxID=3390273 RepID=UPI003B285EAE
MDSETVEMPLDYLHGHKDGLEWAAQLAEANHPETGDWLYDDPIELAKDIRKGPDMPPALSVTDSDPVIIVGDDGGDALSYRRLIQSFEPGTKLYRHAQPAKTVQPVMFIDGDISSEDADKLAKVIRELHEKDERPLAKMARIIRENPHPTNECDMPPPQPAPVVLDAVDTNLIEALRLVQCMLDDYRERNYGDAQGWIRHINTHMNDYTEAHGDDAYSVLHNLITAAPQSPGSDLATVPGKWIPVSEQMPEVGVKVLCFPVKDEPIHATFNGQLWLQDISWSGSDEPIDNVIPTSVTHWMPLPAAPQEVRGE